ncbi:oxidoreductase [Microtetraspora malaysiensis]|uniref:oxidoreductase n=1 Tax=Microtetraspora malaysiensis TaxID=161358 RepID=UPI003D8B1CEA
MGRAGAGLHLPALSTARAAMPDLFAPGPVLVHDPFRAPSGTAGVAVVGTPEEAAARFPPQRTVVHLCTPPHIRLGVLERLAGLGYRKIIVEKPLALDLVSLAAIARLRRRWGLHLTVATHWLHSALTHRLRAAVDTGEFGGLRRIRVVQNKPRFTRGTTVPGHPTAFDIEVPHALAVVLTLAGGARVTDASCADLVTDRLRLPRLGRAGLRLNHHSGVRTEIDSDLTSPVRERRITMEFERATLTGHYPCSAADHTAQLRVAAEGRDPIRSVFDDDALAAFLRSAYTRYAGSPHPPEALPVQVEAVRLLAEAKDLCAAGESGGALPEEAGHAHGVR